MRARLLLLVLMGCPAAPRAPSAGAITAAPQGASARFLIGGDSRDDHAHVLPWAFAQAKARGASGFLFLGDMELTPGEDGHFYRELAQLDPIPFFPVLGNHEVKFFGFMNIGQRHAEKEFRKRFLDTPRTPVTSALGDRIAYSVNLAGSLHFIALDNVSQRGFGRDQLAWLEKDLEGARAASMRHTIVGMHKPLCKNGVSTHGMDRDGPEACADSDAALAFFVRYGVSLLVVSHVHQFARFTQGGIPGFITGGLGAPLDHAGPDHAFHHVLQVDADDVGLHVSVVRFDGAPTMALEDIDDD